MAPARSILHDPKGLAATNAGALDNADWLRALVPHLREGLYVTTTDGAILDANPALLEILGLASRDALPQVRVDDLLADPDRRRQELALLERDGEVRDFELWLIRPDGELRAVLDSCFVQRDPATGEKLFHGFLVDVTRQRALETQLLDLGMRDALTGCYNRRYLADLEERLAARGELPCGCIFIDVDHFKQYNDRYGHHAGDMVLTQMAGFLKGQLRGEEAVVRVGGDEFVLALVGADERRTQMVARSLEVSAERTAPVAFSFGWAVREGNELFEKTIHRADQRLLHVRVVNRSGEWTAEGTST